MFRKLFKRESKNLENSLSQLGHEFISIEEAEVYFVAEREKKKEEIKSLESSHLNFKATYKAQSLKSLEALYFSIYISKKLKSPITKHRFEELIDFYTACVFVNNQMAEWKVQENPFAEGQYQDGILYGYGSWTNGKYSTNLAKKKNDKKDALFNYFMMYVPEGNEDNV